VRATEELRTLAREAVDPDEAVSLCASLVREKSENPPGGEAGAAGVFAEKCRELGAEVTVTEVAHGRPNVLARFPGSGDDPGLAFSGHLDVVPVGPEERGRWSLDPYGAEVVDGELWGRGSVDMKGGLSSAVAAVAALRRAEVDLPGDLWLLASADEEIWMRGAKRIASDFSNGKASAGIGGAVICEPTNLRVAQVCKGRTWATLRVLGQTAHASLRGAGVNAVAHAARLATLLDGITPRHETHELAGESWWAVTEIDGGVGPAIIPDRCDLTLDVRMVPGQTCAGVWDEVSEAIERLAADHPDFRCEVSVVEERKPWEVDRSGAVASAVAAGVSGVTGREAEFFAFPGTTDASYLVPAGLPCVICGPGDLARAHREDERIPVADLAEAAHAYALAVIGFFANSEE